jgi:hypothetical protein
MRGWALFVAVGCAFTALGQQRGDEDVVFRAALSEIPRVLRAGPANSTDAAVVSQRTIGGAPVAYRSFVDRQFGSVIAEELLEAYGAVETGSVIDGDQAGGLAVVALEDFAVGPRAYDWDRLQEKHPGVRVIVRLSLPAIDRLGTYAVVRYELIGKGHARDWASFVKFERQNDGSWEPTVHAVGELWE